MRVETSHPTPAFRSFAAEIERQILAGEIKQGEELPSESKLAGQWGVNRSTVREAIRVLEQNGFVRREPGKKKLFATAPRSGDISQRLKMAMVLDQVTFEELWEAMQALEPAAAQAASKRRTDADLEALDRNLADSRAALTDSKRLTELDIEFHLLVARATATTAMNSSPKA